MNRCVSGLFRIKTSLNTMVRSKIKTSKEKLFLDLFVMKMKKNRLMNEVRIHEKKLKSLDAHLKVLDCEMAKVESMASRETPEPLKKNMQKGHVKGGTMKKIILDY
ncbi:MAG: hypothetical protein HZB83_06945 [Deltaproteobacteria bacterium]|nr:hypothetical protein [Deltaproteobacteria bacterium]